MSIKQRTQTLSRSANQLSDTFYQLKVLNEADKMGDSFVPFESKLRDIGYDSIIPAQLQVLQINIGKLCNQTCAHCHVDAGPDKKKENMGREMLQKCLDVAIKHSIPTVDITGGAPEMNPHFRWFVKSCREAGINVMNRCNLTIITAHKRFNDLPEFFAAHNVHIVSSLPYFSKSRTDGQRGDGVFEASIKGLQMLNEVGYGTSDSALALDLVYNPSGAFLPSGQATLEAEFKRQLKRKYDIVFNQLYAITNLPVSRFLDYLIASDNYADYMQSLLDAFNPATIEGLMCRSTLSVSWDGYLYDCDFNQMLDLKVASPITHIDDFDLDTLTKRTVMTNQHCYGCTAGAGSSCGGEIA